MFLGLDNFLLEEIPTFNNEACEMVISFMQRMPSPLCVIAHNGMKFDFQLLKSELAAKDKVHEQWKSSFCFPFFVSLLFVFYIYVLSFIGTT